MTNRTALANGADPVQQQAAADGNAVQDACNLVAVVGCFHRHLLALHRSGDGSPWQADLRPFGTAAATESPCHFDTLPALMRWLAQLDDTPHPGIR